jgi:hypothetical protein
MLMSDLVDAAQVLVKYGIQYLAGDLSENMLKGINALRCLLSSVQDSAWNFIASAYWLVVAFGAEDFINEKMDQAFELVCTCQEDANGLIKMVGGTKDDEGAA